MLRMDFPLYHLANNDLALGFTAREDAEKWWDVLAGAWA
jgi:hypothetical protein